MVCFVYVQYVYMTLLHQCHSIFHHSPLQVSVLNANKFPWSLIICTTFVLPYITFSCKCIPLEFNAVFKPSQCTKTVYIATALLVKGYTF